MPSLRHLFRSVCTLLILSGLASSWLESTQCDDIVPGQALQTIAPVATGGGGQGGSDTSAPGSAHCCPCIHTFSIAFTVTPGPNPPLVGYSTGYPLPDQAVSDRRAPPLVRPPIA